MRRPARAFRSIAPLGVLATLALGASGCAKVKAALGKKADATETAPVARTLQPEPTATPAEAIDPPSAPTAPPVVRLPDGTVASDEYARAKDLREHGQLWMAHITLAGKALGSSGTDAEKRLLLDICKEQGDEVCVAQVEGSLGKKKAESDLERAEALATKNPKKAKILLEPKLKAGTATPEELRLLQSICTKLRDVGCVKRVAIQLAKDDSP